MALKAVLELVLFIQASLKLRDLTASASQVLGLKAWATSTQVRLAPLYYAIAYH